MERFKFHPKVGNEQGYVGSCLGADTKFNSHQTSAGLTMQLNTCSQKKKTQKSETKKNG